MNFKSSVFLFTSTALFSLAALATSPQMPSAVCKVDHKSIYSVQPGVHSLVDRLKSIDTVSLYGHANLFSGVTLIQDDIYVLFKDIDTRIVIKGAAESDITGLESTQTSAIFNAKNVEMKKHEEIDGGVFTGRYVHTSKESTPVKVILSVTEKVKTDHILAREVKFTLQNGPSATATLNCVDSNDGPFTFSEQNNRAK